MFREKNSHRFAQRKFFDNIPVPTGNIADLHCWQCNSDPGSSLGFMQTWILVKGRIKQIPNTIEKCWNSVLNLTIFWSVLTQGSEISKETVQFFYEVALEFLNKVYSIFLTFHPQNLNCILYVPPFIPVSWRFPLIRIRIQCTASRNLLFKTFFK